MRLANGGNDILTTEERRQTNVLFKIGDAFRIHQIAVTAHGERNQLVLAKQILNGKQPFKGHIRKNMLRPALRRRQLDIVEARFANARYRFLDGIAMIAVGIHSDNALHAASLPDYTSLVLTRRPVSEDSIAAKTARIAVNTLCASMPCTAGFFRHSTNRSMTPDLVWLSLVWMASTS